MLSLFPQILFLEPVGITLLRVTAGAIFLYLAYWHSQRTSELSRVPFIIIGKGAWIVYGAILFEGAVGATLLIGYLTQLAALLGALMALKYLIWRGRYPQFFPLDRAASFMLLAICLSLMVTGAGSYAFDLPL